MNRSIGKEEYARVREFWKTHSNIKIIADEKGTDRYCIIYASSNGVWNPNTIKQFQKEIVRKNKFEWEKWGGKSVRWEKKIFIRDILKEWYVNGVNSELSNIDLLIAYLKEKVSGYKVVCVGNSAGGYIASILGAALGAEYVINISGQFSIDSYASDLQDYPELFYAKKEQRKWFHIEDYVKASKVPILYLYAGDCEQDVLEYKEAAGRMNNLYPMVFHTASHGVTMFPFNYPEFIDMSYSDLIWLQRKYTGKVIDRWEFACETMQKNKLYAGFLKYEMMLFGHRIIFILKRIYIMIHAVIRGGGNG